MKFRINYIGYQLFTSNMRKKAQNEIEEIVKNTNGSGIPYLTHYTYEEAVEENFGRSLVTRIEVFGKSRDIAKKLNEEMYDIEMYGCYIFVRINNSVSQKFNPSGQINNKTNQ